MEKTKEREPGLYLLGLDIHISFLVNKDDLHFCHASYYPPYKVLCEKAINSGPIIHSKYLVVGKILDDELMVKWLKGQNIKTVETKGNRK